MFNEKQVQVLKSEIDTSRVKTREKGNITLSYLEGHDVIDTANKIFGFGNWSYTVSSLEMVSQELNQNQNNIICYKAIVKVDVYNQDHSLFISREDVGFGTGISKNLADAHEGAGKEAITDCIKRSFKSYGNQLGLSLYNKDKSHVPQQNQIYNNPQKQQQYQNLNNQPSNQKAINQGFDRYEFQSLYNLGLEIFEQNGYLIIRGNNQYAYRDAIKASGFKFDPKTKTWWRSSEQGAA